MPVSTVFRHLVAVVFGAFAWWYFYAVESFVFYPQWVSVIVAAFIISLVVAIISENLVLGPVLIMLVYILYGPGLVWSFNQFIPLFGGVAAASAVWKII